MQAPAGRRQVARARVRFASLAVATVAVGLALHWRGTFVPAVLRDVLGDALWAMMIGWWIGALAPRMRAGRRAAVALALSWAVEFSQLYHAPAIDAWRHTTLGALMLGTGFDGRDLGAYALGVFMMIVLDLRKEGHG